MAERLTEKDKYGNNAIFQKKDKFTIAKDKNNDIRVYGKAIDKLAHLEDIMEKYGIESVEELDKLIDGLQASVKVLIERSERYKIDHNIWIKAYEIALKESGTWWKYDDESNTNAMELYYLKAKELIKNENKINIDKYKFNKEDFIKDFDNNDIKKFENLICKTIGIDNDENKGE